MSTASNLHTFAERGGPADVLHHHSKGAGAASHARLDCGRLPAALRLACGAGNSSDKQAWPQRCCCNATTCVQGAHERCDIHGGWRQFARDNNIKVCTGGSAELPPFLSAMCKSGATRARSAFNSFNLLVRWH